MAETGASNVMTGIQTDVTKGRAGSAPDKTGPLLEADVQDAGHNAEAKGEVGKRAAPAVLGTLEQWAIALALVCAVVLLALGPGRYCWLHQARHEVADDYRQVAHTSVNGESCHQCQLSHDQIMPALRVKGYMNDVVTGGVSGLLMMVATVLAGIGAGLPGQSIFAVGSASLAAYSFSVGFGAFVIDSATEEFAQGQLQQEYHEIRQQPSEEVNEMVCHYRKRGLSEHDAQTVAKVLSRYEDFWAEHMMMEELGLQMPRGQRASMSSGLATGVSFLVYGAIPMLGLAVSSTLNRLVGPQWYRPQFATLLALGLSALLLWLFGIMLSRAVGSRTPVWNATLLLAVGCAAAFVAFKVSSVLSRFCSGRQHVGKNSVAEKHVATTTCNDVAASGTLGSTTADPAAAAAAAAADQQQHGSVASKQSGNNGSLSPSGRESSAAADSTTWPSFQRLFSHGLCALWVGVCTIIVCMQSPERMAYDSLRVFGYGWLTCITTGLGAVPFMFISCEAIGDGPLAGANAVAGGMMLSASVSMLWEAHDHCGPWDWQILAGILAGVLFIRASERLHSGDEGDEEEDLLIIHGAFMGRQRLRKALLICTVMFCHSAAEGIAVGVAFSKQLRVQFGYFVTLLLAVHNIPEGLAVALVLVPRGVSSPLAALIATLTSVPQPLLALAAYVFVDAFRALLPLGLAFAAGAMVYVCCHELLTEANEHLGMKKTLVTTVLSFIVMSLTIGALQSHLDA